MPVYANSQSACFLCEPDERLVYLRDSSFFAMLGLGPLGEGYSLIATVEHLPSMLDLDSQHVETLIDFTARVQATLLDCGYPPVLITEHGRVAACVQAATARHEPHCMHAHWLLFPGAPAVDLASVTNGVEHYNDFRAAHREFDWPGQYLYSEAPGDGCWIAPALQPVPRQLMRRLVGETIGMLAAADWRVQPGIEIVEAARRRLVG